MSDTPDSIAAARIEAERARARLTATIDELHGRVKPDVLVRQGVDRLRARGEALADEAMDVARERPGLIGGVGATMLLLWLRRPLGRGGRGLFLRKGATAPQAAG